MDLNDYFKHTEGIGILATADADGIVDSAIYARPHVFDDQTIGFIMRGRLSHQNLKSNPYACYLFIEKGDGYHGKRLYLKKLREKTDPELIKNIRRKSKRDDSDSDKEDAFLVYFKIDHIRPLVGDNP